VRSAHKDGAMPRDCQCRNKVIKMMYINGVMKRIAENKYVILVFHETFLYFLTLFETH